MDRLVHYFSTYKLPRSGAGHVSVGDAYGRTRAEAVIEAAIVDYKAKFGDAG